jgi:hypothetical protein
MKKIYFLSKPFDALVGIQRQNMFLDSLTQGLRQGYQGFKNIQGVAGRSPVNYLPSWEGARGWAQ